MNVLALIVFMGFMTNANVDSTLNYGKHLQTVSTAFQSQRSLTKKSFAVTVDSHQTCNQWNRFVASCGQQMYQIQDFYVICSGQILIRMFKVGARMIEVFHLLLVP